MNFFLTKCNLQHSSHINIYFISFFFSVFFFNFLLLFILSEVSISVRKICSRQPCGIFTIFVWELRSRLVSKKPHKFYWMVFKFLFKKMIYVTMSTSLQEKCNQGSSALDIIKYFCFLGLGNSRTKKSINEKKRTKKK